MSRAILRALFSYPVSRLRPDEGQREALVVSAARAVIASLRDSFEAGVLPPPALASLRVLETALDVYDT